MKAAYALYRPNATSLCVRAFTCFYLLCPPALPLSCLQFLSPKQSEVFCRHAAGEIPMLSEVQ